MVVCFLGQYMTDKDRDKYKKQNATNQLISKKYHHFNFYTQSVCKLM